MRSWKLSPRGSLHGVFQQCDGTRMLSVIQSISSTAREDNVVLRLWQEVTLQPARGPCRPPYVQQTLCTTTSADRNARETSIPVLCLLIVYPVRRIASLTGIVNAISTSCLPSYRISDPARPKRTETLASIYPLALVDEIFEKVSAPGKVV